MGPGTILWEFPLRVGVTGQAGIKIFKYWPLLILYWTGECSILVRGGGRTIFQYRLVSDPNTVLSSIIINLVWLDTIQKYYGKIREILSNSSIWSNDKLCLMQAGQGRVMTMKQWTCDNVTLCPLCVPHVSGPPQTRTWSWNSWGQGKATTGHHNISNSTRQNFLLSYSFTLK